MSKEIETWLKDCQEQENILKVGYIKVNINHFRKLIEESLCDEVHVCCRSIIRATVCKDGTLKIGSMAYSKVHKGYLYIASGLLDKRDKASIKLAWHSRETKLW